MFKKLFILIIVITLFGTLSFSEIMKLKDLKIGMEGSGKTIYKGTDIETFKFKILGFIENFSAGKTLIIAELYSPVLAEGGIVSGMSGSPVYIDGKIIGAVAYGFGFSKKPIGGITPIEDILKTDSYNKKSFQINISDIKVDFGKKNVKKIWNLIEKKLTERVKFSPNSNLSPIKLISYSRGMSPLSTHRLNPIFTPLSSLSNLKLKSNSIKTNDKNFFKLRAADAVSIPLVRGDFEYSSSGTVTFVDGKKAYLFGHPFFNLGAVSFPLHKAEVITIVPSYQSPFKLSASKQMIGTVTQDRFSSVVGELGKKPYMIPLKIFLKDRNKNFKVEIVNHPLLTPALSAISLNNVFTTELQEAGFQSLMIKGKIFVENEKNINIDELYSGSGSYDNFSNLVMAINFFLMNNKEKEIKIQKMDFEVTTSENIKKASIENVLINKQKFKTGELIKLKIKLKNDMGKTFTKDIQIKTPMLTAGTNFYILIGDRNAISRFDAQNIKSSYFPPDVSSLIRAINNIRKGNRIYVKVFTSQKGLFLKGREYSNMPESLTSLYKSQSISKESSLMTYSTLMEYQMKTKVVVSGKKMFKLMIREK